MIVIGFFALYLEYHDSVPGLFSVFFFCVYVLVSRVVVRLSERAAVVGGLGFTSVCIGGAGMFLVSDLS